MVFLRLRVFSCCTAFVAALPLCAQTPTAPQTPTPPASPYTLHVYANLIQLPTMVLGVGDEPQRSIAQDRFRIRIDGGPWFKPTRMHMEGPESLMLGVVLDASGSEPLLQKEAPAALASLASTSLTVSDRLSIAAFDCAIFRSNVIAPKEDVIRTTTEQTLDAPGVHSPNPKQPNCLQESRLIDTIAVTAAGIAQQGTRRALIVVSDGYDRQSKHTWEELIRFAHSNGIAVFAVRTNGYAAPSYEMPDRRDSILRLRELCRSSGGLMLETTPQQFSETLSRVLSLLRSRYILEFPRPANATGGRHYTEVKLPGRDVTILFSGVQAKLPDEDERSGATTVPHDATNDPQQGKHPNRD